MKAYLLKSIIVLSALITCNPAIFAQPYFEWAARNGGISQDQGYGIVTDASGNVYTCGEFMSDTVDFDPGPGTFTVLGNSTTANIFIQKLDLHGNFLWVKTIAGPWHEGAKAITLDAVGNIYFTGYFNDQVDFDPGPGVFNLGTQGGQQSLFIEKLDAAGNFVWAKEVSTDLYNIGNGITVDALGDVLITGAFYGACDFDPGVGTFNITNYGSPAMFILKLDASGNFAWVKQFMDGGGYSTGMAIKSDASGNIYTIGEFSGTTDFDPTGTYSLTSVGGGQNAFLLKLNSAGNFIYAEQIVNHSNAYSLSIDNNNDVLFSGTFSGTVDFDPGSGTYTITAVGAPGASNTFIQKLGSSGNFVWVKTADKCFATATCVDGSDNIYIGGNYTQGVDVDPGPGTFTLSGSMGMFIQKLSSTGNFISAIGLQGDSQSNIAGITTETLGNVYITGTFFGICDFDESSAGTYTLGMSSPSSDAFVAKYSPVSTIGFKEYTSLLKVKVFPNPTSGVLNIQLSETDNIEARITDISGRTVSSVIPGIADFTIHLNTEPGLYFLEMHGKHGVERIKIIKE
jgi:hypothetical protein